MVTINPKRNPNLKRVVGPQLCILDDCDKKKKKKKKEEGGGNLLGVVDDDAKEK